MSDEMFATQSYASDQASKAASYPDPFAERAQERQTEEARRALTGAVKRAADPKHAQGSRQGTIAINVGAVHEVASVLEKRVEQLAMRLETVLVPAGPVGDGVDAVEKAAPGSPLSQELARAVDRLSRLVNRLGDLQDRIEL